MLFFRNLMRDPHVHCRVLISPAQWGVAVALYEERDALTNCKWKLDARRWLWMKMKLVALCALIVLDARD